MSDQSGRGTPMDKVYEAIDNDKKITAIKEFRAFSGMGLRACKHIVEIIIEERANRKESLIDEALNHWNHLFDQVRTLPFQADYCPLCKEYKECIGCPVAKVSGYKECRRTPYVEVRTVQHQLTAAIAKEIDFLESLKGGNNG